MDDKRIEQVLEIEKKADAYYQAAISQAAQLPRQAENEAQELISQAHAQAEEEARKLVEKAAAGEESDQISSDALEQVTKMEAVASMNLNRAITYVLARVVGRE